MSTSNIDRRDFVVTGLAAGAAVGVLAATSGCSQATSMQVAAAGEGRLTLHAIDTYYGQTREGLIIDLSRLEGGEYKLIKSVETVKRGRTAEPLLEGKDVKVGRYELLMHLDDYFAHHKADLPTPQFLSTVAIRFGLYDANQKFHVPILFSPWSYSYYRGS